MLEKRFDRFATDTVTLMKQDGAEIPDIKAIVQPKEIITPRGDLLIEPGDLVRRKMSNGGEETYKVIDPRFFEKTIRFSAFYQMTVHKLGIPEAKAAIKEITINVTGDYARVNQNSVDQSTNVVQVGPDVSDIIERVRHEIRQAIEEEFERRDAFEVVDAIEQEFKSGSPKRSVVKALIQRLPTVGSIASIAASLLSVLG